MVETEHPKQMTAWEASRRVDPHKGEGTQDEASDETRGSDHETNRKKTDKRKDTKRP
jgi:hypothetical protein